MLTLIKYIQQSMMSKRAFYLNILIYIKYFEIKKLMMSFLLLRKIQNRIYRVDGVLRELFIILKKTAV